MHEYFMYVKEHSFVWMNKILFSVAVFILFYIIAQILYFIIKGVSRKFDYDKTIVKLIASTTKITFIIIGIVTALGTFGINITALVAGLGLTGFALGFAMKDTISNLLSGIMIMLYRPFREGDKIKISGFEGVVTSIDLRYTKLDGENEQIIIPNSKMFADPIVIVKKK